MITVAFNCPVDFVDLERLTKNFLLLRVQAMKKLQASDKLDLVLVAASFGFDFTSRPLSSDEELKQTVSAARQLLQQRLEPMLDGNEKLVFEQDVTLVSTHGIDHDLWVSFILETRREKP